MAHSISLGILLCHLQGDKYRPKTCLSPLFLSIIERFNTPNNPNAYINHLMDIVWVFFNNILCGIVFENRPIASISTPFNHNFNTLTPSFATRHHFTYCLVLKWHSLKWVKSNSLFIWLIGKGRHIPSFTKG